MAAKLFPIEESLHRSQDAIQRGSYSLQMSEGGSHSEEYWTEFQIRLVTQCDTIEKGIPVARAPVFNYVNAAGLKMIVEEVPETYAGQLPNVRAVINNNVESIRRILLG
jgi:hypothetical protein